MLLKRLKGITSDFLFPWRRFFSICGVLGSYLVRLWIAKHFRRRSTFDAPVELRIALEKLGATFIKFGQILAMRPDFIPYRFCEELFKVLDQVPPFPTEQAVDIIQTELKQDLTEAFSSFEQEEPLASASFGQVYSATLKNGEEVVVKVKRPGIENIVKTDLRISGVLVWLYDFLAMTKTARLGAVYREFREWTLEELDYRIEAGYMERIRECSESSKYEKIPKVYAEYTTSKVLVIEYLSGVWLSDAIKAIKNGNTEVLGKLQSMGVDLESVAKNIFHNGMRQIFQYGIFHADPHGGNILIMENNVIGYIDFGIVGVTGEDFKPKMLAYLGAISERDPEKAFNAVMDIVVPSVFTNLRAFHQDFVKNISYWLAQAQNPKADLSKRSGAGLLLKNMSLFRKHKIIIPELAARYYRNMVIIDIILLVISNETNLVDELRIYFRRHKLAEMIRNVDVGNLVDAVLQFHRIFLNLPQFLRDTYVSALAKHERDYETPGKARYRFYKSLAFIRSLSLFATVLFGVGLLLLRRTIVEIISNFGPTISVNRLFFLLLFVFMITHLWIVIVVRRY